MGNPGDSQLVGHTLRAGMAADPSCVMVQVDWRNAFSTLQRDKMLAAAKQRCLTLLPMVAWAYSRHSHLLVHQVPCVVVQSQSGVRQGDPPGHCSSRSPCRGPVKWSQRCSLLGHSPLPATPFHKGSRSPPCMQTFAALTARLGLHAQPAKSSVLSEEAEAAVASVAGHLGLRGAPDGLLAAGTLVAPPAFQAAGAGACADHSCQLMDELQALPPADQALHR
jgi:hypothetical protein